eukprot:TRINITY_DN53680_c0_g1_i1.p1 TRINITY_DN53680_c0_g1~~TRINITY_DN53680_c0_g1_i1.p1  ORF type:complete len:103 (-),score=26.73 TRINITY_DN53680_c0_g1_i1:48-356(-)
MLVSSHINSNLINMSKLFVILACLTLAVAFASAEPAPRFAKLQTKLSCSLTDVYDCEGEIEDAWNNCWNADNIMDCINGILGASDCVTCVCDVLGWLGLMEC